MLVKLDAAFVKAIFPVAFAPTKNRPLNAEVIPYANTSFLCLDIPILNLLNLQKFPVYHLILKLQV